MASQHITDKNTLKSWFQRGLKPLASQFAAWMDSYWHKDEKIPTASVEALETILNQKAETTEIILINKNLSEHIQDTSEHKTEKEQSKLDHLADNPDATYVTVDSLTELKDNSALIIPVDFTLSQNDTIQAMVDFVTPYFEDESIFTRPLYLMYIYKEGLVECKRLIPLTDVKSSRGVFTFVFDNSFKIKWGEETGNAQAYCFEIFGRPKNKSQVRVNPYKASLLYAVYLYENCDGKINSLDSESSIGVPYSGWGKFHDAMVAGCRPMVFLKTRNSATFCPASYEFVLNRITGELPGNIQISYIKETDNGISELHVETYRFSNFVLEASYDYCLKKYPLGDAVRVSRIQVVETLPTPEDGNLQDGDIIILKHT